MKPSSEEVEKGVQNYTIISPRMKNFSAVDKSRVIVCHKLSYPYAVFYCHSFQRIRAYMVPLQGSDGTTAKAVAICQADTSRWNPKILQGLKVEPGTVPVCHFLSDSDIAWVSKQKL
ncbi:BURP domain protein RD22-like [Pyrus x bretschneideri]|uniref:BURP domain protein RD22-like n=1 Tax=Pyrus x bretschneideri TaxID=225117 RepID=UPI0020305A71|nr:BURP domain protein RD22-like [Pyrus x bretschneideri]